MLRAKTVFIVSILFISICVTVCNAQFIANPNSEYRLLHKYFEASNGEKGVTTYTYDSDGRQIKALWHLLNGKRSSLNIHHFDEKGNLIVKERIFSDSRNISQNYEYSSEGKVIRETFSRVDGVNGSADYQYDATGRLTRVICKKWNGWLDGTISFEYGDDELAANATVVFQGKKIGEATYSYDDDNNLTGEEWQFNNGFSSKLRYVYDVVQPQMLKHFTYSNVFLQVRDDKRVVEEKYNYSNRVSGYCDNQIFDDGMLVYKEYKRSDNFITKTDYFYDSRYRLTKSYRRYPDGKTAFFIYHFNDDDQLVKKEFYRSDGIQGLEEYTYSTKGFLQAARWINFDSWLTGRIEFSHTDSGLLDKGRFKGDRFNAEIKYGYDEENRLILVHWDFSFDNATQTYEFKWGPVQE